MFIEAKDDGSGGDNWTTGAISAVKKLLTQSWSYKSCKPPVKSSPPTNQHPTFYRPDAIPIAQPTVGALKEISDAWTTIGLSPLK